ncbi:DUF2254 domain-containing protein [Nitrospira moscoviensis]|uniref:DUF2254 domain-containing protein n=1 Tax=Nitrospira moscoviensis TaxID=42253 RepID=A0A0K2GDT5_NITMO|nr:DUF2254 domain-containing protein [Nitrospira moscoviensis]ALA59120.1 conserved membrane protein of unknown function [Nitrospira moscoviensis]
MFTKLSSLWDRIRGSLWFVPSLMAAAAVVLAFTSLWADHHLIGKHPSGPFAWLYGGGADGARDVLSTVASSMITVAGVIFSITVVALTLASQQFGPRLLRNFMRDPGNQIVLGTFISVHLYCLIILRAVRTEEAGGFVPHLSVSVTLLLAMVSAGVLIYFFHHATSSIRASSVIAAVAADLDEAIDRLFPERVQRPGPEPVPPPDTAAPIRPEIDRDGRRIVAPTSGYLQALDTDCLGTVARADDLIIRVDCRPGDFLTCGTAVARAHPAERVTEAAVSRLQSAFILGDERTVVQDVRFPAHQLTEMAVRALSPGTNDPSTALACIDRLGAAFIRFSRRRVPSPYRYDEDHRLRLILAPVTLAELIEETFSPIRQYGRTSAPVTMRLLDAVITAAPHVTSPDARAALHAQAVMVHRGSLEGLPEERDRREVLKRYQQAQEALTNSMAA